MIRIQSPRSSEFPRDLSVRDGSGRLLLEAVGLIASCSTRLRCYEGTVLRWERTLPVRVRRAWIDEGGECALVCFPPPDGAHALIVLGSGTGRELIRVGLERLEAEVVSQRPGGFLDYAQAGFLRLPGRRLAFGIRCASGVRVLLDLERGAIVPNQGEEEALAAHEAACALRELSALRLATREEVDVEQQPFRDVLGAAALCVAEQGLSAAVPGLRALEWRGGACCFPFGPSPHYPSEEVYELRRLAQRALILLGHEPRPLPGARVIRGERAAAIPASLSERAAGARALVPGLSPEKVLRLAGNPDDLRHASWDYALGGETLRVYWRRRWIGSEIAWVETLGPLAGLSRLESYIRPLPEAC